MKKKILSAVLALLMVIQTVTAITVSVFAWNWKTDGRFEVASYRANVAEVGAIKVDAGLDDVYLKGTKITSYPDETPYKRRGAYTSEVVDAANGNFTAYIAVDTTGMFIYAEIQDTTIFEKTNYNGNDGDCFQIYFDWCTPDIVHPSPEELYELYQLDGKGWNAGAYKSTYGVSGLQYIGWISGDYNGALTGAAGFSPTIALGPDGKDSIIYETKLIQGGWAGEWFIPWRDQEQKDMIANGEQFHCGIGFMAGDDSDINNICTPDKEENVGIRFDQRKEMGLSYWADYSMLADVVFGGVEDCKHTNYEQFGNPVPATCTEWGFVIYRCSDCRDHYKTELTERPHTEADGHEWINVKIVQPSCFAEGYTSKTCSVCNKEDRYNIVPKNENYHAWDNGVKTDSTCTEVGVLTYTCKFCGKTRTTDIAAKGHKWVAQKDSVVAPKCEGVVTKENPDAGNGYMTYICSGCGASKEVVIKPRENHVYIELVASKDTCTTVGHVAGKFCQWCFAPAPGVADIWDDVKHNWERVPGTEMKEATCEEDGFWTVKCTICGVVEENKVIPAIHHEGMDSATAHRDPTCTTWGYDLFGCTHCGEIFANKSYEPLGHKYDMFEGEKDATCTEPSGKNYSCSNEWTDDEGNRVVCGARTIIANEGAKPLGHSDLKVVAEVPATCEKDGIKAGKKCGVCDAFVEGGETIAKLGHDIKITVCTIAGKVYEECTRAAECKYVSKTTDKIFSADATESHSFVKDGKQSTAATCTTDGQDALVCRFCAKFAVEVVKATGHNIKENKDLNRAPNCTNDGYYSDICKNCGEIFNAKVLPKIADAHVGIINTELSYAATCVKEGQEVGDCGICGKPYIKALPKLGHDLVNVPAKAPTCTNAGNTAGSSCKRCGEIIVNPEKIYALGHNVIVIKGIAATCTEKGLTDGKHCSVCGKVLVAQVEVAPLGHDYVKASDSCPAACGDKATIGYDHMACSRCDSEYIVKYADIPAHIWGETIMLAPNCEQDGFEYQPCTVEGCTAKNIDETTRVPALGHKWEIIERVEGTCLIYGYEIRKCIYCGEVENKNLVKEHIWDEIEHVDPTCTKEGYIKIVCKGCGSTSSGTVPALGHNMEHKVHVNANCQNCEHDIYVCTVCKVETVVVIGENLGSHSFKEIYRDEKSPTFEKAQKIIDECTVCGVQNEYYKTKGVQFKTTVKNLSGLGEKITNKTEKIQITIALRGDKRATNNFNGKFMFNCDHLEFISAECPSAISGVATNITADNVNSNGRDLGCVNLSLRVNDVDGKAIDAVLSGEYEAFVTLIFRVKNPCNRQENIDKVSTSIDFVLNGDVTNSYGNKIAASMADTRVNIYIYTAGDINRDGKITNVDILAILKYIYNSKDYPIEVNDVADVDGDGEITNADVLKIHKYIFDPMLYPISPIDHDYYGACDTTCDECGAERVGSCKDHTDKNSDMRCDVCRASEESYQHDFEYGCECFCNACKKEISASMLHTDKNLDGICDRCGEKSTYTNYMSLDAIKAMMIANSVKYDIGDALPSNPSDYAGNGATAWVTNDDKGLYIYAEVEDATPTTNEDGNVDSGDKFKVYLDVARDSEALGKTAGDYSNTGTAGSMRLGWVSITPDEDYTGHLGYRNVPGIKGKTREIDGGYAVALFIPLNPDVIPTDRTIGLAFVMHDDTDGDNDRNAVFFMTGGTDYWCSYEKIPNYTLR